MTTGAVPDPSLMELPVWQAEMVVQFPEDGLGNWPWLPWRQWGLQLFRSTTFSTIQVPDPLSIVDRKDDPNSGWKEWARRLRQAAEV